MDKRMLEYLLGEIHALTFVNPFSPERAEKERGLLAALGEAGGDAWSDAPFSARLQKTLEWVSRAEQSLLKQSGRKAYPVGWREPMASLAYFALYHEVVADLDRLIQRGEGRSAEPRKVCQKIQAGIEHRRRLIEHGPARIWNRPEHLFACFYQLRRAYCSIHNEIIGESQPIRQLRMQVWESVFTKDMMSYQQWMYDTVGRFPTLILGPSGSGKELVARAIGLARFIPYNTKTGAFEASPGDSFHPVNLSALSSTLIESELFGHRKGAFTGAVNDREGLFAAAGDYGTVFLDEIGEVGESTQVKLLRLLQSGEYQAVGSQRREKFTGKIIAATHRDLGRAMETGAFREDFFHRLRGDQVQTPSLREILKDRPEDLSISVSYICSRLFGSEGAEALSPGALAKLKEQVPADYAWPGNFRELEQAVRSIIVRDAYRPVSARTRASIDSIYAQTSVTLAEWSQLYARQAYQNAGSYREAARLLDVDQRTLKKWVVDSV